MNRKIRARKKNNLLPIILIGIGALLVLSVLVLQIIQSPDVATAGQNIPEPDIARVSLANSKSAFDGQTAIFLDVRDALSFADGHIPGAINIPYDALETRAAELDPNAWIITYCT